MLSLPLRQSGLPSSSSFIAPVLSLIFFLLSCFLQFPPSESPTGSEPTPLSRTHFSRTLCPSSTYWLLPLAPSLRPRGSCNLVASLSPCCLLFTHYRILQQSPLQQGFTVPAQPQPQPNSERECVRVAFRDPETPSRNLIVFQLTPFTWLALSKSLSLMHPWPLTPLTPNTHLTIFFFWSFLQLLAPNLHP